MNELTSDAGFVYVEPPAERYEDVLAKAQSVFPNAEVSCVDGQWVIYTGVNEVREVDPSWAGTPAEEAYNTYEANYGSDLERWAYKNGHGSDSLRDAALAFNASLVAADERMERLCAQLIAEGKHEIVEAYRNGTLMEYHKERTAREEQDNR